MPHDHPALDTDQQAIDHILKNCRSVAVVGLSPKAHRDSYRVAHYLQQRGWRVIAINPVAAASGDTILGERVYASLSEAAQHEKIDLVDVFRNSEDVPPVVDEAIAIGAPALWLQLGVRHDVALQKARTAGLVAVQNLCLKVEHARRGIA
ncbi:MAG TPA: CoA-binding protein [Rhodoferax sp.]|nr:CoA-binding protein [Rhodoferax sp.]